jgi:hypothetical protein
MRPFFTLVSAFIFFLLLNGCQKKIDEFIPDSSSLNAPDTVWQSVTSTMPVVSLKNDLRQLTVYDSFTYNNTGIVFNSGNYSLSIPANALLNGGSTIPAGTVVRESLLLQKKGDYISQGTPTETAGRLLISGGEFFIGLKNNNTDLHVATGDSLTVKYNSSNIFTNTGSVYNLTGDIINGFNWVATTDPNFNKVSPSATGYEVVINQLQWVQPAYLFDTTGIPEIVLSVKLPSNYTNTNTVAYISFNNMQCVAGMNGNVGTKTFVSGQLPVARPVTIVVISKQAGDYYLGLEETTTALPSSGSGTQEIGITPVKTSLAGIKSYLTNL